MASGHFENRYFVTLMLLVAVLALFIFLPELNVIVLGISLAILFQPWYEKFQQLTGGRDGLAAGLIVLIAIAIIFIPLIFFGFEVFLEAQGLYGHLSSGGGTTIVNIVQQATHSFLPSLNIDFNLYAQQAVGTLINNIGPIFSGVVRAIAVFFLSFFAFYYFLKDGSRLGPKIVARSPFSPSLTQEILSKFHEIAGSIIRGLLVIAALYGIFVGIGFFIFGLPSAILWGGITVIASFIPGIGVMLVVVPGIIYLASIGNTFAAVGLVIWTIAMSTFMEAFIRPWLLGRRAKIHPLLMLLAVLGGLSFFGPIGILLGPLVLGILLALLEIYPSIAKEAKRAASR
jgi:predicted PurR-regulated permease PerM